MTYNYVMSLAFVSIALQKVVIGKEIIGIDTIQIIHHNVDISSFFNLANYFHCMF